MSVTRERCLGEYIVYPARKSEIAERCSWYSVKPHLKQLFPRAAEGDIPSLVEEVLDAVVPFCQVDEDNQTRIIMRGSAAARLILGTPTYYWQIPEAFSVIAHRPDLLGTPTALVRDAVSGLISGPDIDLMIRKKSEHSDDDVIGAIENWGKKLNCRNDISVKTNQVSFKELNGVDDPRKYVQIEFRKRRYGNLQTVLRLDIGQEPLGELTALDGRLSMYMTSFDMASVVHLAKKAGGRHWYFAVQGDDKELVRRVPMCILASGVSAHLKLVAATRLLSQQAMWRPCELPSTFDRRQHNLWIPGSTQAPVPSLPSGYWENLHTLDEHALAMRAPEIISRSLLGMTVESGWPILAQSIGFLPLTELGRMFQDINLRNEWIRLSASSRDDKPYVDNYALEVADNISRDYRLNMHNLLDQIQFLGPLDLVRKLEKIGVLGGRAATLSTMADLINPIPEILRLTEGSSRVIYKHE